MKKKKNRLSNLIKWELVCLVAVTLLVTGLIRWSEGRVGSAGEGNTKQTASGTVKAQEGPEGKDLEPDFTASTERITPRPGDQIQAGGAKKEEGIPSPTQGTENPVQNPESSITSTPVPTKEIENPQNPTSTPRPTPTKKPESTPSQAATPAPTKKPENKPSQTITPAPTKKPESTPTPENTPTPKPEYADGMDGEFIDSLGTPQSGEWITADGAVDTLYYMQTDSRWGNKIYGGEDTIAKYACGPTSMAIVVSSLTDIKIDPVQMSGWAFNKGYWYPKSGSLHSVVNGTARAFGLKSEGVGNDADTQKKVTNALKNGDMVVVLMGKGHFTKGGHFIVLRGITAEGKILVADCNSRENTMTEWDFETIQSEAKWASDGGPFWIIRNPNIMQ